MTSLFSNLNTAGFEEQKDTLGGFQLLETGVYPAKIKTVYITTSQKGAMAANVVLDIDGREHREQLWITNAEGKNFYVNKKTGGRVALPGFATLNDMCICSIEKNLDQLDAEPRVFKLYDYETKSEMPKEVPTIVDLMDTEILVGITKQIVDKTVKDASGNYVPSGETREENVIEKVFYAGTKMTANEAKAGLKEASFHDKWLAKNAGKVKDKTKKDKASAGTAGAPQKPVTKSLFG